MHIFNLTPFTYKLKIGPHALLNNYKIMLTTGQVSKMESLLLNFYGSY